MLSINEDVESRMMLHEYLLVELFSTLQIADAVTNEAELIKASSIPHP